MKAVELFCGAGGTSLGFELTGQFETVAGLDIDEAAMDTFRANHPRAQCFLKDITKFNAKDFVKELNCKEIDILIGGPSCQGYSTIGKRIADDPRNSLYINYLDYVAELSPKWLVFENVKGFIHSGKGHFYNQFRQKLNELGYNVSASVLNAADFGVPQRRERVIIIACKSQMTPALPCPTHEDPRCPDCSRPDKSNRLRAKISREHCEKCEGTGRWYSKDKKPWVSLTEAIDDLEDLKPNSGHTGFVEYKKPATSDFQKWCRNNSVGYDLHKSKSVSEYAKKIISHIPEGGGIRNVPEEHLPERFKVMRKVKSGELRKDCTTLYGRLSWGMPSYTITCYFGNVSSGAFTHPIHDRPLTIREAARLQSFPDRYEIKEKKAMMQLGNAVPPLLSMAIAHHILFMENHNQKIKLKESQQGILPLEA